MSSPPPTTTIPQENFFDWCEKNREIVGVATALLATGIFATCYGLTCRGLLNAFQTNDPYTFSAWVCMVTTVAHEYVFHVAIAAGVVSGVCGVLLAADESSDWSIESRVSHYTTHHPKIFAVATGILTTLGCAGGYYVGGGLCRLVGYLMPCIPSLIKKVDLSFLFKGMTPLFILAGCGAAYYTYGQIKPNKSDDL